MSYVGYTSVPDEATLRKLIEAYSQSDCFFFLKWLHQVSGIVTKLPDDLSPEGQLFNTSAELRWKKKRLSYEILWLGQKAPDIAAELAEIQFASIDRSWQVEDHPVLLHQRKTPQYPNLFRYPLGLEKRLQQRYFRDVNTGIVHFVALTVRESESSKPTPDQE